MGKKASVFTSSVFTWSPKKMIFRILLLEHQNALLRKKIMKESHRRLNAARKELNKKLARPDSGGPFDSDKNDFVGP